MFYCKECGFEATKWSGKCPGCGEWNTFKEVSSLLKKGKSKRNSLKHDFEQDFRVTPINVIEAKSESRIDTGFSEFNCVLGGGVVKGMVALIGGEPGIGKSTIMLQLGNKFAKDKKVLYVSGEESEPQIKLRSLRLNADSSNLLLYCSVSVDNIIDVIIKENPEFVIIDSIQSVFMQNIDSVPGSISQLREVTGNFTRIAKKYNIPFFLIGHVTKEGSVAGPKIIEHMVDTVLYFETELNNQYRIIRTTKNRFGSTNEIGVFEMTGQGLKEVLNPSRIFLDQREETPGTAIGVLMEGSRAFLIEVQALVTEANYGNSQRVALGIEQKRLSVIIAIIEKHLHINLKNYDIFVTISGHRKISDSGLDIAIVSAILSSYQDIAISKKMVTIGEISLAGELRSIFGLDRRVKEAAKLGFDKFILPKNKLKIKTTVIENIREIYPKLFEVKE